MDVIRKSDPYCVAYVDGEVRQEIFMTETVSSCLDPTWNANFKWALYPDVTCVTIAVWDRDNVTADDLIGTAFIDILDLAPDETSRELELSLENPRLRRRLIKSRILVRIDVVSDKPGRENPSEEMGD
ncbi:hypothetical protein GUITHDRAFT_150163 [Guillardia theta CCMP2712]|uniref:C2 domain-containing protein n=2 Tax=Guillardia theta TaxID=55529 RepID=L1K0I7_GUITC|nr:hypothetical protein GUITHDRAFT_150163 [Guillardia theta CCMP2712]EKX54132.1 hypothetical protein GUITHDRAFT_150163 [Guillardia theta CCMP2712]|eukprot:XP_005841112.1 hypothetical protein GUITHDRAFT_150163 [Guillardia theta CCMP2712]